ncbi:urate hydroxylase PuuD [Vreelandella maris]|uniref:Urate hydroxylase PuuD n=1 Tax=Vreelandella maris TaxID=2729617 RepID=A0A7Y6RA87_9GAMM|nr:urate hydroxylase PuuD [Halomonas maris]NVF13219.1 urate hydroxylase PuuD [Halomonas maris]|tara:strand:- start:14 stop:1213 length:1200 start_codon:yes stop_codon:yes gene_type:complete
MQAYLIDFVNLLLRWLHVIAAIAWIGESIYFVMLDNSLRTPKAEEDREKGVFGEMWSVHGGGFYHNQKYATAPAKLPNDLHWSFWKAYTTWLSGFALFVILYMVNPGFYLVNPNSPWEWAANMTGWQANVLALAFLLGGWVVYNELCKRISPNMDRDGLLSIAVAVMMVIVAYLSTQMFTGRAAFLLTGAVMATAMSANVFFWIIPGQRRMVKAMKAGDAPNPLDGKRGKQRSVHNTYFTLPVVLLMVSNHYSFIYSHELAWVVMVLFIFAGALIRQFFVLMHAGKTQPAYPAFGVGLILLAFWVAAPSASSTSGDAGAQGPDQAQITGLIEQHCVQCHARNPEHAGFSAPPAGFAFDSWDEILGQKTQIQQVVASRYMPLGNMTNMSDEERDIIAAWE